MAALLPAAARLAALQKDCAATLPALFDLCSVMQFDAGQLTLSAPNAAMAAKAKQQLPKLQESLLQRGWQVNAIKIKVQVRKLTEKPRPEKRLALPPQAISALAELRNSLEDSAQNKQLKSALEALLQRHRRR
ncbi:DciA family protein [Noviherbaspirillum galbum]|nr:DciA family protein [Noviherbaspirillum galbum]